MERMISEEGQKAVTHYEVLSYDASNDISLVKLLLETGRTHQIRVHLAYIGNPILGDTLYGKTSNLISRQALHAWRLSFIHPILKEPILIETSSPFRKKGRGLIPATLREKGLKPAGINPRPLFRNT